VIISDQVMDSLPIMAHHWHGEWNYTLRPESPAALPEPRLTRRDQPGDRAPAWLHHPTLTCMNSAQFAQLLADVERHLLEHPPISLSDHPARQRILRRGPLSLSDRLLVTLLRQRWSTQVQALTTLHGTHRMVVTDAAREIAPIQPSSAPHKAPIKAPTTADLARLVGGTEDQDPK
jgi:hypothetical protein